MEIKSICVVGGGRMGRQIALNAAIYGFKATVYDLSEAVCADVTAWAEDYLAGRIAKGRMTEEQVEKIKSLFKVETDLQKACEGVDCVVEAIIEIADAKRNLFRQLSEFLPENTIIATNSSAMVSSDFAGDVKNPARLCNMHFYNPALVLKFVEVVQGPHTSPETAEACVNFCKQTGKTPVWMKKELRGFLGNYVYGGISGAAKTLVEQGVCSPYEADLALEYGFSAKMGVFRTNDLTGIKLSLDMMRNQMERTGEKLPMFEFYEKMVAEGRLGRSCGHGFYDYDKDPRGTIPPQYLPTADPEADVPYTEIRRVAVVGGGRMGRQIALASAIHGHETLVYDLTEELCRDIENWAEEYLAGRITKGRMTQEQVAETKARFRVERDLQKAVANADLVVESVLENLEIKRETFRKVAALVPETTIIATNASVILSSQLADAVNNPSRICNLHFYNPALVMQFVEVVQGPHTSTATARACYEFALKLGKKPAWLKKEVPGFLGNYIWGGLQRRARHLVHEGYCSPQDVDTALEQGFGYKSGPFRTWDLAGIDVYFYRQKLHYEATGEKSEMYDIFEEMVKKGHIGRKSGKGFYDYT